MKNIFLTGGTGFVGKHFRKRFSSKYKIIGYSRNSKICINEDYVLHFAGKAHDLVNVTNPKKYYDVNTELTIKVFDAFLKSCSEVFIFLSSVKAVADKVDGILLENFEGNPKTHYGKSKLQAENYILSKQIPKGKRVYILRPCMIYGPGNKGNLNLLYKLVSKKIPWPLGAYENKRSYCYINNLLYVLDCLMSNNKIPSGIYNISDKIPLSTNEIVSLIAKSQKRKHLILFIPKFIISFISKIGDILNFPLNTESFNKLTSSYIVSSEKILNFIDTSTMENSYSGMLKTFKSFNKKIKNN